MRKPCKIVLVNLRGSNIYLNTGDLGMKLLSEFRWFRTRIQKGVVMNIGIILYIPY
jgi:hypothetical protein